ncbi:MAG: PspC domain-containing protein [Liquorilactobacillus nagelii]|jgi:phage shock protein PspC (stress-responsive transcriptional regulator)|uniref:PspC domain-containing protein n=1 Tax=Liquorilactobacillus nagelii TaxID=82688 RepID=UPI0006EF9895|nr:PspC domain-containing protein [Liquorilactobacillus nagelii]KRL42333.1 hypothetical protein FD45_GL002075 [Liquorilactobacillus nagelii DSM 13675]QYH53363.1 PspC domain-containing protein [Liquorilactobacillus nagelii DSM 13675]
MNRQRKLTKSADKIVSGVFGGIAEYFSWDKSWTRIIGALLIIFPGQIFLGILLYVIAAIVMPDQQKPLKQKDDTIIDGDFRE